MRLMFVGDISLGEHFFSFGHGPRSFVEKGGNVFEGVEQIFAQADFVFGNLEGPLSDHGYDPKDPLSRVFRGAPKSVHQLKKAGVNVLSIANNHSLQHGEECFYETVDLLRSTGIEVIGLSGGELQGAGTILTAPDGTRIGVIAASDVVDNEYPDQTLYNYLNLDNLCAEVMALAQKASVVIVVLHWGVEGHTRSSAEQKKVARKLIESGALVVVGHHPHVFFEVEKVNNSIVAYSLGDFVFDLPWDKHLMRSGILDISFNTSGGISNACLWPVTLNRNGIPKANGTQYIVISSDEYSLYNNDPLLSFQIFRKLTFFSIFLLSGDIFAKIRFLLWKIKNRLNLLR